VLISADYKTHPYYGTRLYQRDLHDSASALSGAASHLFSSVNAGCLNDLTRWRLHVTLPISITLRLNNVLC